MIKKLIIIVMMMLIVTNIDARRGLGSTKKELAAKAKKREKERKAEERAKSKNNSEKSKKKKQQYMTSKKLPSYYKAMLDILQPTLKELPNPELSIKNKNLCSKINSYFYTLRKQHKAICITDKGFENCNDPKKVAPFMATYLQACYFVLGDNQRFINYAPGNEVVLRGVTPKAFVNKIIPKVKSGGVSMALGIYNPATKDFEGKYLDDHAKGMLVKLLDPEWKEKGIEQIAVKGKFFRMVIPMYMNKKLGAFHGGKLGDKDDYGNPKQGFKEGDYMGGVVVTLKLN